MSNMCLKKMSGMLCCMVLASQTVTDTIGYIAIVPLAYLLIPQILLTYRLKHTEGVSVVVFYTEIIIGVLNIIYGVLIEQYPIIVGNAIIIILSSILVYMYFIYPKKKPNNNNGSDSGSGINNISSSSLSWDPTFSSTVC